LPFPAKAVPAKTRRNAQAATNVASTRFLPQMKCAAAMTAVVLATIGVRLNVGPPPNE